MAIIKFFQHLDLFLIIMTNSSYPKITEVLFFLKILHYILIYLLAFWNEFCSNLCHDLIHKLRIEYNIEIMFEEVYDLKNSLLILVYERN